MESIIRNVKDIEADQKHWLESALNEHLRDNQRVLIMVLNPGVQADEEIRKKAIARFKELTAQGGQHREQQGVSAEDADRILDESIEAGRRQQLH
ncbi:MAG: hypothetical protein WD648_10440 [Planctomycetaceae bacterium]